MEFLQEKILDNTILSLLVAAGVILGVVVLKKLLSHSAATISYMLISRTWKMISRKQFAEMFLKPLSWFLIVSLTILALSKLTFPSAWQFSIYKISFRELLEKIAIAIFIYSFIRLVLSVIDFAALILGQKASLTKDKSDDQLVVFFRDFIKVLISIAGVLLILKAAFNQNIGNLLTGLSIVGAALALSARESLENLIASFIIFFDKPFYVGDTLKVNTVTGKVERIGLRSTRIRTADKTLVTVPNKQMVDSVVDNYSMRTERRAEIKLEFSEKTRVSEAENFLGKANALLAKKQQDILKFTVFLTDYSKNGCTVTLEYFTPAVTMAEFNKVKQEVNLQLMQLIEAEKMELASAGNTINILGAEGEAPKSNPIL
jgi:MscS family membrane protein